MLRFLFIQNLFNHLPQRKNRIFFYFQCVQPVMISTDKCVRGHLATRLPEPSPNESRTFELTDIHKPWLLFMSSSFSNIVDYFFLEESLLLIQYILNVYKWTKNNILRKLGILKDHRISKCFKYKFMSVYMKGKSYNSQKLSFSLIKSPDWHL